MQFFGSFVILASAARSVLISSSISLKNDSQDFCYLWKSSGVIALGIRRRSGCPAVGWCLISLISGRLNVLVAI